MVRAQIVIAFLLGAVVALGAALVSTGRGGLPEAYAQSSGNNDIVALMGTMNQGKGPTDNVFLFDTKSMRICVYQFQAPNSFNLVDVRNVTYDFKLEQFGRQDPSVGDVRDKTREEDKKPPKK